VTDGRLSADPMLGFGMHAGAAGDAGADAGADRVSGR
jgi:hypothetical protein